MDDDAVHQVLSAASDAEINVVLEAAAQLPDERCKMRWPLLQQHMREVKARRRLERQGKRAPRVQSLVQVYNEDMAKTASQIIGPLQRRREKQRGQGWGSQVVAISYPTGLLGLATAEGEHAEL